MLNLGSEEAHTSRQILNEGIVSALARLGLLFQENLLKALGKELRLQFGVDLLASRPEILVNAERVLFSQVLAPLHDGVVVQDSFICWEVIPVQVRVHFSHRIVLEVRLENGNVGEGHSLVYVFAISFLDRRLYVLLVINSVALLSLVRVFSGGGPNIP